MTKYLDNLPKYKHDLVILAQTTGNRGWHVAHCREAPLRFRALDYFGRSGMPLYVGRVREQPQLVRHAHEFSELVVVLGGAGVHVTETERYRLGAGDAFAIRAGSTHGYAETAKLDLVNILFDSAKLGLPAWDMTELPGYHALFALEPAFRRRHRFRSRLRLSMDPLACVERLLEETERELAAKGPGYRFAAVALFMQTIAYLCRCYSAMPQRERQALVRLGRVMAYLEGHYAEEVNLAQLGAVAGMSGSTLLRAFRQGLGHSPMAYVIRLRVRKGAELLRARDVTVTEAAGHAGFSDSNYFSRQFRRVMGVSPREFRRTARESL